MDKPLFRYTAQVLRIIDGDTIDLLIDEGFKHSWKVSCRLAGINAPELRSTDIELRARAQQSKDYLAALLPVSTVVYIISQRLDKYGRPIIDIYLGDLFVNQDMIDKGFAVQFM